MGKVQEMYRNSLRVHLVQAQDSKLWEVKHLDQGHRDEFLFLSPPPAPRILISNPELFLQAQRKKVGELPGQRVMRLVLICCVMKNT